MKNINANSLWIAFILMLSLSSCDLAGDIFEAGAWTAIIMLVLVIAIIIWIVRKFMG